MWLTDRIMFRFTIKGTFDKVKVKVGDSVVATVTKPAATEGATSPVVGNAYIKYEGGNYMVYFDGLNPNRFPQTVEVTAYSGNTQVSKTLCYSIDCYIASKGTSGSVGSLGYLLNALALYGDAVRQYKPVS